MIEMNGVSLLNQMRLMTAQATGSSVEINPTQAPFGDILQKAIGDVNQLQQSADALKAHFEMGDANTKVSEVMIAGQKADLAFEALLRVRNKIVQAYQDIMSMPV
ncbi:flagellar hook-basal body complex protein FliE [Legionella fairfieldensis]|uniref:flagellar hook-basal body complex protein FliE n=1 Tax=Legionella fairfieldensis TaxID=45064 RepID=UPI000491FC2D|nr:flagellar hook-basal body complex protein FliE [Legionella fairfieldensis]